MNRPLNIMLVGESWFTYSIHQKGFDTFQTADYTEGATEFIAGLERLGHGVRYIPAHRVDAEFPADAGEFTGVDAIILSDVGANTFLLTKKTFNESAIVPNRLEALRSYVLGGGGLLMVGGYMSFAGIDGKARYGSSPLADVLPVSVKDHDDRIEVPEGFTASVRDADHPALAGVPGHWPRLLGYNQVVARDDSLVLVGRGDDPILAVATFGSGRSAAFTPDLAPHWAPPEFVAWEAYPRLWDSLLRWLAQDEAA
ncbi:MAG: glutamine amidotransferase [Chloroflexota bacterium]|nr:glutamine amidotransferase [Chloroflexota bacterium]